MRYGRRIAGVRATLASRSVGFEKLLPLAAAGDAALQAVRRALGGGGCAGWSVGARERCVLQVNGKGHPYTDPRRRKARHTPRTIATAPHTVWLIDLRPESSAMSWVGGRGGRGPVKHSTRRKVCLAVQGEGSRPGRACLYLSGCVPPPSPSRQYRSASAGRRDTCTAASSSSP